MKRTILVLEDNPVNSELVCGWLEMEGFEAQPVDTLAGAFAALTSRPVDLILLDIDLGADSGLDLLPWLKNQPTYRHIPVLAVTAHAMVAERQRILEAGCVGIIAKPVDFELLRKEMQRWLPAAKRGLVNPSAQVGSPADPRQLRVLVVEDDPASLELLQQALQSREIEVRPADNGRLAAILVTQEMFDGVFVDLSLPEIDGIELIRLIRKSRAHKRVPIVVVSGREDPKAREEAFTAGATFFLHKPIDHSKLQRLLNSTLGALLWQHQQKNLQ